MEIIQIEVSEMKIVYRAVNILLAVLILLSAFFVNFVEVRIETSDSLAEFFKTLSKDASEGAALYEDFSIKRVVDIANGKDDLSQMFDGSSGPILWPEDFNQLNTRLIVFASCFGLILLIALFILIFSIVSKRSLPVFIAGFAGIAADIVMILVFRSMADDIFTGKVNMVDFIVDRIFGTGTLVNLIGSLAGGAFKVILALNGVQNAFLFIFIAVVLWTAIFFLVDLGDPKAKELKETEKEQKAKKKAEKAAEKEKKKALKEAQNNGSQEQGA